jgi:hypothetical protein
MKRKFNDKINRNFTWLVEDLQVKPRIEINFRNFHGEKHRDRADL